jgi:hypothetical protein
VGARGGMALPGPLLARELPLLLTLQLAAGVVPVLADMTVLVDMTVLPAGGSVPVVLLLASCSMVWRPLLLLVGRLSLPPLLLRTLMPLLSGCPDDLICCSWSCCAVASLLPAVLLVLRLMACGAGETVAMCSAAEGCCCTASRGGVQKDMVLMVEAQLRPGGLRAPGPTEGLSGGLLSRGGRLILRMGMGRSPAPGCSPLCVVASGGPDSYGGGICRTLYLPAAWGVVARMRLLCC